VPTVADVVSALDTLYPPRLAASWDAVGLVCGDPDDEVSRVLFVVDVVDATVAEAVAAGAEMIVAHHPLLLRGVHGVPATTYKGRLVHRLIRSGVALHVAHTNADDADPGVSDALAARIGLAGTRPLVPRPPDPDLPGNLGTGRIGELPRAMPLRAFVHHVAASLPATAAGVRASGDPDRPIRTVAVSGGAGDGFLADATRAGVDAFVTADLRHHPASEHDEAGGPALVDVAHWASERPWLDDAAALLRDALRPATVETVVSDLVTDVWTLHGAAPAPNAVPEETSNPS
jgi:dinuclear metal center YbgI/SA1388 family protein